MGACGALVAAQRGSGSRGIGKDPVLGCIRGNCAVRAKLDDVPSDFNLSKGDHWIHSAPDINLGRAIPEIDHHDQVPTLEE
jgi:hypothetical protein